ncbi:hypothetical protein M3O75_14430 [Klebsiella pneumoniae]|nr:hypothetical protein [Klebsiella pneumoniae]
MAENTVYFPEAFLAQMRAAMPAHLSSTTLSPPVSARYAAVFASIR